MTPPVPGEVDRLGTYLEDASNARSASGFPGNARDAESAGLYSWWADEAGRGLLGQPFGVVLPPLIYAGQTGATTKRSGTTRVSTLRSRIGGNHLGGNVQSSTFRKTLTAILIGPLRLELATPNKLTPQSNVELTAWMHAHLRVATIGVDDREGLAELEEAVLEQLDPPLNLMGMASTPIRVELRRLRSALGAGPQ